MEQLRLTVCCGAILVSLLSLIPDSGAEFKWLSNDGYAGDDAYYQAGFVSGEILASRFDPAPGDYPLEITQIAVYIGDSQSGGSQANFILHIWNETGLAAPGTEYYQDTQLLTANNDSLTTIQINPPVLISSGSFRVGLEFTQNPPPSFFRDADGNINNTHNFIYAVPGGWHFSYEFGLQGDWILRAGIMAGLASPTPPPLTPTPTPPPLTPTSTPQTPAPDTPTPEPSVTPTGTQNTDRLVLELSMPSQYFRPGDSCHLSATIINNGEIPEENRLIVALLVADEFWFWPSWSSRFDSFGMTIQPGINTVVVLQEFTWPDDAGEYSPIYFFGALTNPDMSEMTAFPDIWMFGFGY